MHSNETHDETLILILIHGDRTHVPHSTHAPRSNAGERAPTVLRAVRTVARPAQHSRERPRGARWRLHASLTCLRQGVLKLQRGVQVHGWEREQETIRFESVRGIAGIGWTPRR